MREDFATRLRRLMRETKMTAKDVETRSGVRRRTVEAYLCGCSIPRKERMDALASIWGAGCFDGIAETEFVCSSFAVAVLNRMRQLKMSRENLVRKSGVSHSAIARLLSGRTKTLQYAQTVKVCEALGIEIERKRDLPEENVRIIEALKRDFFLFGESASNLADKAGVHISTIKQNLLGECVSMPETLEKIARAMGTTVENWKNGVTLDKIAKGK